VTASPTREDLDRTMRAVLLDLSMISHGTTQSFNAGGGGGGGGDQLQGCSGAEHLHWAAKYERAADDTERRSVVKGAETELARLRGRDVDRSRVVGETREEEDARIVHVGEGFTADEVATRFKTTPTRVRRARLAAGREVEHGRKPGAAPAPASALTDEAAAREAARMKSQGMSERQIALVLARPKSTVHDWVKAA
jgi:hypothetical protein